MESEDLARGYISLVVMVTLPFWYPIFTIKPLNSFEAWVTVNCIYWYPIQSLNEEIHDVFSAHKLGYFPNFSLSVCVCTNGGASQIFHCLFVCTDWGISLILVVSICAHKLWYSWWHHHMETFSTLLAICEGNSPVTGEFPTQRPVTRSFDVFFDPHLN